jgi:heme exporter protein C
MTGDAESHVDKAYYPAWEANILAWAMWGLLLIAMRYALERRRQEREQDAALKAIEDSLEFTR